MASRKRRRDPLTKAKTAREIKNVKRVVEITGRVFSEMGNPFGRSERDVAKEIRQRARMMGASLSFRPIVASGRNSGYVHHKPGRKIVREDEPVIFDIGFKVGGQCSDVTRMHIPEAKKSRKFYVDTVQMQRLCIASAKPGRTLKEINELWKGMMKRKGYAVKHGIGHGVGFRVHERVKGPLKPGMVITIEPGIYEKGKGGCRVEDMVLITRNKPIVLTKNIGKV
jgi:Xaa-Pro aminopeptidase